MNPIKNLWHHLKTRIKERRPKSIKDLKEIIIEEWKSIPKEICQKLVDSMSKRAFDHWMVRGNHTKH